MKKIESTVRILIIATIIFNIACKTAKKNNNETNQGTQESTPIAQNNTGSVPINAEENALLDGNWQFAYFTSVNTDVKVLFPGERPKLYFDTKVKRFTGNAGCNSIGGYIKVSGNQLQFVQPITLTKMACNASGEKLLVDYLSTVQRYRVTSTTLELFNDSKPCVVFSRVSK